MTTTVSTIRDLCMSYAQLGLVVLPKRGKHPVSIVLDEHGATTP